MPIVPVYHKVERLACKASIAIEGLSGKGKSGLALALGYVLAGEDWDGVYVVDTENKSTNLYVDTPLHIGVTLRKGELNKGDLTARDGFSPLHYSAYRQAAIDVGGKVWIADSLSHAWQYAGGILDQVSKLQQENKSLNKWTAWGVPQIVDEKAAIMDLVRSSDIHTITTLRVKEKLEMDEDDSGKKFMRSLGEQQLIMPDFKYEPDLVLSMVESGYENIAPKVKVLKSRYRIFKVGDTYEFTKSLMVQLRQYLEEGTNPEELLELQRLDYIQGVKEYLDEHPNSRPIWNVLKEQHGLKDIALKDMALKDLKLLYAQIAAD